MWLRIDNNEGRDGSLLCEQTMVLVYTDNWTCRRVNINNPFIMAHQQDGAIVADSASLNVEKSRISNRKGWGLNKSDW